jgi:hypothetical protein
LPKQHLLVKARVQLRHKANHQVDLAILQAPPGGGGDGFGFDVQAWRGVAQVVQQARQQHHLADVRHANAKSLPRQRRVKRRPAAVGNLQLRQDLCQCRVNLLRERRRLHALCCAGKQLVVKVRTQLVQ